MKKLSLILLSTLFFSFAFSENTKVVKEKKENPIVGVWIHTNLSEEIEADSFYEMKIITDNSVSVLQKSKDIPFMILLYQGTYELTDNTYIEFLTYKMGSTDNAVMEASFSSYFKDGLWYIKGTNNAYDQVWKKIKE